MSDDFKMLPMLQQNKTFTTEFRGVRYDYYLTGPIGAAEDYLDLCNILRSATPQDEVVIRINSGGGSVHTGNMIINAINESEANVIGFIESDCGSMSTFIFLACHTWGVSDAAEFFIHTCSYGNWGKESEVFSQAVFMRKQVDKMVRTRYKAFLTEDEISAVVKGEDLFFDAEEILERLEGYAEARDARGCGEEGCTDCNQDGTSVPMPSIDSIIEKAVSSGVEQALENLLKKYTLTEKEKPKKMAAKKKLPKDLLATDISYHPSDKITPQDITRA